MDPTMFSGLAGEIRVPVTPGVEPIGGHGDEVCHWVRNRAHQTLRPIADLGKLLLSGLKLLDELLKFQKLVGDHRALVAVHHRPQNEPDQEFIRAGDTEDAEGRDGRGQRKDERPCNDSFVHHDL